VRSNSTRTERLTGETGAKPILVEAVGLPSAGASGDLVAPARTPRRLKLFESGGEELLVRREITAQDAAASSTALATAAAGIVEPRSRPRAARAQTLLDLSTPSRVITFVA
jgi:hypothetical protein